MGRRASKLAPPCAGLFCKRCILQFVRELPMRLQEASNLAPRAPKLAPGASKLAPRTSKLGPSGTELAQSAPKLHPSTSKWRSKRVQGALRGGFQGRKSEFSIGKIAFFNKVWNYRTPARDSLHPERSQTVPTQKRYLSIYRWD